MARSEYGDDWEKLGKPKDPNAPKRGDYVDSTAKSFVKNVAVSTAAGAYGGAKTGVPGMALLGGALGFTQGLFGMESDIAAQEATFDKAWSSWRTKEKEKEQAKWAGRARHAEEKSQKKGSKQGGLTAMTPIDQQIMMSADPTAGSGGSGTGYGNWLETNYPAGVA